MEIPSHSLPKNDSTSPLYLTSAVNENGSVRLGFGDGFTALVDMRDIYPGGVPRGLDLWGAKPSPDGRSVIFNQNAKVETVILRTLTDDEFAENLRERLRHDTSQALKIVRDRAINKSQLEVALSAVIDFLQEIKAEDPAVYKPATDGLNAAHELTRCLQEVRAVQSMKIA